MKRGIILVVLALLLAPFISAEIILEPIKDTFTKGEILNIPTIVKSNSGLNEFFYMTLICNGQEIEFYKEYMILSQGEERHFEPAILLVSESIGPFSGSCVVKAAMGDEVVLSNDFSIQTTILVYPELDKTEFLPEEEITIIGNAERINGLRVNGFLDLTIESLGTQVSSTVKEGRFSITFSLPPETASAEYTAQLHVYEKDYLDLITNEGLADVAFKILQVPTSLEISSSSENVNPGESISFEVILLDQTQIPIPSTAISTIKDFEGKIIEQSEHETSSPYTFTTEKNSIPGEWEFLTISNDMEAEIEFDVLENFEASFELINDTLLISNIGNVPYNKTVLVKIGNESGEINVSLAIGESTEYKLSAQDGEHLVEISDGENSIEQSVALTGSSVGIKESSSGFVGSLGRSIIPWVFIILVFGATVYITYERSLNKTKERFTQKHPKSQQQLTQQRQTTSQEKILMEHKKRNLKSEIPDREIFGNLETKSVLSLSIQGPKQSASIVCIKIKNLDEIKQEKSNVKDTIHRIVKFAEDHKAMPYKSNEYLFLIFSPSITKSFKNDKGAVEIAQYAEKHLKQHNEKFKQKIDFGISVNHGDIIAKYDKEKHTLHFSSLGNSLGASKKIADFAERQVLLSKSTNEKLLSDVKTEKLTKKGIEIDVYKIEKVITRNEDHKKFIDKFLQSIEEDKKKQEEREKK
jgi:hypothetical protein